MIECLNMPDSFSALGGARVMGTIAGLLLLAAAPAAGQSEPLGLFEGQAQVGTGEKGKAAGAATYDPEGQTYTVADRSRSGAFRFAWKRMSGALLLRARLLRQAAPLCEAQGGMMRAHLGAGAPFVSAVVSGDDGSARLRFRRREEGPVEERPVPVADTDVLQLARQDSTYTVSAASFGDLLTSEHADGVALGEHVYAGLFARSCGPTGGGGEGASRGAAAFGNVRIVEPAPDSLVPYEDYLGSRLEVMDVESGKRTVRYRSPASLQAPNWTPDGDALIYNSQGRLYRFDLGARTPEVIDTGFATSNNNDHVLSPSGDRLGISHHSAEHDGASIIYTVPSRGGTPEQITPEGPSYLHGWSPDGTHLTYTGERDGAYDIYKIAVQGGEEVRLTRADGLDDGSEYAPDGEHIYFNSARTGTMQLWRMKPDGTKQEQLTDDALNDWFPHVSPDGQWIVFLSYRPEVAAGDHPFYRQVYLRRMPVEGGPPEVIAYVYGGQGTINVPSWAPGSEQIAFVSNSGTIRRTGAPGEADEE